MTPDASKPPCELTGRDPTEHPKRPQIVMLGEKIVLSEDHFHDTYGLVQRLNHKFAEWARAVEAACNESADRVLSDMCRDSLAYCTGYHRGADVMTQVMIVTLSKELERAAGRSSPRDRELRATLQRLLSDMRRFRKHVPAPNPDDEGFGRRSEERGA